MGFWGAGPQILFSRVGWGLAPQSFSFEAGLGSAIARSRLKEGAWGLAPEFLPFSGMGLGEDQKVAWQGTRSGIWLSPTLPATMESERGQR